MAESAKVQDSWSDGVSKLMESSRAHMTGYNLAAAGVAALTAGAVAYFWDQSRRNAFLEGAHHMSDQMKHMWGMQARPAEGAPPPSGHA